jgi:hypothetical protein
LGRPCPDTGVIRLSKIFRSSNDLPCRQPSSRAGSGWPNASPSGGWRTLSASSTARREGDIEVHQRPMTGMNSGVRSIDRRPTARPEGNEFCVERGPAEHASSGWPTALAGGEPLVGAAAGRGAAVAALPVGVGVGRPGGQRPLSGAAGRRSGGIGDPGFATKPHLAAGLVRQALAVGVRFRAVVGDSGYGPDASEELPAALTRDGLPYPPHIRCSRTPTTPLHPELTTTVNRARYGSEAQSVLGCRRLPYAIDVKMSDSSHMSPRGNVASQEPVST